MTSIEEKRWEGTPITWESLAIVALLGILLCVMFGGLVFWVNRFDGSKPSIPFTCTKGERNQSGFITGQFTEAEIEKWCGSAWPSMSAALDKACPDGWDFFIGNDKKPELSCTQFISIGG